MNALSRSLALSCLVLLSTFPAVADDDLVGMWSSTSRTKGGLGSQWIFTKDGTATQTFGALVDFNYEINGAQITTTLIAPDRSLTREVSTLEFSIDGDTLTENPRIPDRKQIMIRTGNPYTGAHPIIGEWTYKHYTGSVALMRYSSAGASQLSVPFKTFTGTYRTSEGILTVLQRDQRPSNYKFKREKDFLVLTDANEKETRFLKFGY